MLLNKQSKPDTSSFCLPEENLKNAMPEHMLRPTINLPELSEGEVTRHYVNLSRKNFGVDNGFYPLGSCTMKYNPKINEAVSRMPEFNIHPLNPKSEGNLAMLYEMEQLLSDLTGMSAFTLQPAAGAHGELCAMMMIQAYFKTKKETRTKILIPDSAHGTNPASAAICGFECVQIKSNAEGDIDLDDLKTHLSKDVAALMLTNPNTLGLFEKDISQITNLIHQQGALVYMDGANMNAIMGIVRPADLGIDVMHLNLHKTFATPHGGGGPGSGPVGVAKFLEPFLPGPRIKKTKSSYDWAAKSPQSIGKIHGFYGNFNVVLKAYTYIVSLGGQGLKKVSEQAVLNANYMKAKLAPHFHLPYDRTCLHEFVLSDKNLPNGVTTLNMAKRLLDFGFHPMTVYFPLIVPGAMMIEPTETESKKTMDAFIDAMIAIKKEADENPELVKSAPHTTPVKKLDEVAAARNLILNWQSITN